MPEAVIRTIGLTRRFGPVTAVDSVDLTVGAGELYGFLGRNGAGKTTTIRMLLGMIRPDAGEVAVLGRRPGTAPSSHWGRVGYLVESATAYPDLTLRENLDVARTLHGAEAASVDREIERLGLEPWAHRRARTLSTGNLQRLALARALLHEPELVILDEPTQGLDPAGVREIRELLRSLTAHRGVTVFMSTHILTEVERLATRIGVVHHGRLVAELSANELEARRRRRLEVEARDLDRAEEVIRSSGYDPVRRGVFLEVTDPRALERPDDLARHLVEGGAPPTRIATVQEDLESFFLSLTEDS
jgi:ABC-2 type transport system ATP-binding protein